MNIGLVLNRFYPDEIRLTKEANILIPKGFKHFLLCAKRKGEKTEEVVNNIPVTRISVGDNTVQKEIMDTFNAAFWSHPIFEHHLHKFITQHNIQVLKVHDIPIAQTVIKVAKKHNCKVIIDMHENYPAGLQVWSAQKDNPIVKLKNKVFYGYNRWLKYEKSVCDQADYILTVVDEMTERLIRVHQLPKDKVVTVLNAGSLNFHKNREFLPEISKRYKDKFLITYVGGFGPHRGLDTPIKAMPTILKSIPNALLLLVGGGSIRPKLEQLANSLGVAENVVFTGSVPFKEVYTYMKISAVNTIPHHRNEHTDHTIPHKLFQSMMTGQPVLVSSSVTLKRIIEETDGGFIFEAGNPESFAKKILFIKNSPEIVQQKTNNAQKHTLQGSYNWENNEAVLLKLFNKLKHEHPLIEA